MKLIVGLGNPGRIYIDSRHNIGFSVVRALNKACKIPLKKEQGIFSLSGRAKLNGCPVLLAIPLTFMNLSGKAVAALLKKYKIGLSDLLVVCDDLDLEFGRLKIRPAGSSGGHHGLQSIIDVLESDKFCRLRLGIGRPRPSVDPAQFVLSPFTKKEKIKLKEATENALDCCRIWAMQGISESMNIFNKRSER
ncbi:MAG: aminoacyl-tRNA hydrolase [Omnitrophica WOR_2 bacterium RIFCSPLOWO2_01_FULL_41_12]|nr:MAG: aminoacyl-tRNA hydrolase [Omnitrophica WOR_2 bacterium RIFCSPLOWO2_01_FULL_41_12]